jgi:acetylornithine deacetylase
MDRQQEVFARIENLRPAIIEFLQKLVRFRSLPGEEQEAQLFIAGKMGSLGCGVEILRSDLQELVGHPAFCDDGISFKDRLSVVGTWRGSGSGESRSLILNGHMDVVPTGDAALWKFPPWDAVVQDSRLHGRGACDMKAGLAAAIFAMQALGESGFQPAGNILFESVIGEESGGVGTLTTLVRGFRADAAIIMEPTRLRACPVHSGALCFRLKVSGRAIHASMKRFGISAVEKFYAIFSAMEALDVSRHAGYANPLFEFKHNVAPISIGIVASGDWPSTVPDELIADGRFGVFPGESIDEARAALAACIDQVVAADPWLSEHRPTLAWVEGQFEPGETDADEPIIAALSAAHARLLGARPIVQGVPYGSDLRLFTLHGGIPAVLYGPGDVAFAHTVEEHVELEEVFACTKVLASLIVDWCGGEFVQPV